MNMVLVGNLNRRIPLTKKTRVEKRLNLKLGIDYQSLIFDLSSFRFLIFSFLYI